MPANKAVVVASPGHAEIRQVPYPALPQDDYMLVKVLAVAINPTDPSHVDMTDEHSCEGCHVGCDMAGVVVEVGPAVTKDFKPGDRVAGGCNGCNRVRKTDGSFALYTAVKGDLQVKVPDAMTDAEAATLGVATITTGMALYRDLQLPSPTAPASEHEPFPLFIYGGSTAMGVAAVQYAKLSGATVIATASPANFDYVKSFGADHVLDYNSETIVDDVRALTDGKLKLIYDCFPSEASGALCAKIVSGDDAKYASLTGAGITAFKTAHANAETFFPLAYSCFNEPWYLYRSWPASPEDFESSRKFVETTSKLLEQGKVKPPNIFLNRGGDGFEGVLHGINDVRAGNVRGGKLVYTIN